MGGMKRGALAGEESAQRPATLGDLERKGSTFSAGAIAAVITPSFRSKVSSARLVLRNLYRKSVSACDVRLAVRKTLQRDRPGPRWAKSRITIETYKLTIS